MLSSLVNFPGGFAGDGAAAVRPRIERGDARRVGAPLRFAAVGASIASGPGKSGLSLAREQG